MLVGAVVRMLRVGRTLMRVVGRRVDDVVGRGDSDLLFVVDLGITRLPDHRLQNGDDGGEEQEIREDTAQIHAPKLTPVGNTGQLHPAPARRVCQDFAIPATDE
jgi:hypothetical protein